MKERQKAWFWLIRPEDSSSEGNTTGSLNTDFGSNGRRILSLGKFIFWYGTALSLSLLLGKLH